MNIISKAIVGRVRAFVALAAVLLFGMSAATARTLAGELHDPLLTDRERTVLAPHSNALVRDSHMVTRVTPVLIAGLTNVVPMATRSTRSLAPTGNGRLRAGGDYSSVPDAGSS